MRKFDSAFSKVRY